MSKDELNAKIQELEKQLLDMTNKAEKLAADYARSERVSMVAQKQRNELSAQILKFQLEAAVDKAERENVPSVGV